MKDSLHLAVAASLLVAPAQAATEIIVVARDGAANSAASSKKLATDFNASQSDYRVVPTYKGSYTETVSAAIFAFRSGSQPAIVQVNEIATATMMAATGAIYPVLRADARSVNEPFVPSAYLPTVAGYYADVDGNMLSFPFNASTPILYYNKDTVPVGRARSEPSRRRPGRSSASPRSACAPRGVDVRRHHVTGRPWINVENFLAPATILPIATRANGFAGLDAAADLQQPAGAAPHRAARASGRQTTVYDYSGRGHHRRAALPERRMRHLHRLVGDPRRHRKANAKFEVGYGALPMRRTCRARRRNSIIGGATLWVLRDRPRGRIRRASRKLLRLSVAARGAGRLAPEHGLSADHPRRFDLTARAGFL